MCRIMNKAASSAAKPSRDGSIFKRAEATELSADLYSDCRETFLILNFWAVVAAEWGADTAA